MAGRLLAIGAIGLAILSLVLVAQVVLSSSDARDQVMDLQFPLDSLGEDTLFMILPILLSALAAVGSVLAIRRKIGRIALAAAAASWVAIWLVLGTDGFKTLF